MDTVNIYTIQSKTEEELICGTSIKDVTEFIEKNINNFGFNKNVCFEIKLASDKYKVFPNFINEDNDTLHKVDSIVISNLNTEKDIDKVKFTDTAEYLLVFENKKRLKIHNEIANKINSLTTKKDYESIKQEINKIEDNIDRFDLFCYLNNIKKEKQDVLGVNWWTK